MKYYLLHIPPNPTHPLGWKAGLISTGMFCPLQDHGIIKNSCKHQKQFKHTLSSSCHCWYISLNSLSSGRCISTSSGIILRNGFSYHYSQQQQCYLQFIYLYTLVLTGIAPSQDNFFFFLDLA